MASGNYQICKRCVMDTSDPQIVFDELGICNHCKAALQKLENYWFPGKVGEKLLEQASAEIRASAKNREYDCIIGVSGGVDSSYLLYLAKEKMQLNPLVVHVDAGWNSEIAVKNIENLVKKLGLELYTCVVDWMDMKDVQLAYLKSSLANQDVPQDHAFFAKLYEFAMSNRISYVLTGSNLTSESILPSSWGYDSMDAVQLKHIHKVFGKRKLRNYPIIPFWKYKIYYPYIKKMKIVSPLNWIDYDKNKAIEFLKDNYGWRYYGGKHHESRWTKFFQAYYLPEVFSFDKRRAHLSSLIVAGQMDREAALRELEQPLYDPHELEEDKRYIAKKLGLSSEEFDAIVKLPNKTYLDYPNHQKYQRFFSTLKSIVKKG